MKIIEIFPSLQGEGIHQGKPCLFVRLAGCNLNCSWCDTKYSHVQGDDISIHDLLEKIKSYNLQYVCITGGEPLIQIQEIIPLVKELYQCGITVDIETNGTIDFTSIQDYASICMDIKCPSSNESSDLSLLYKLKSTDCVKFVIGNDTDYEYMTDILHKYPNILASVYVTSVYGTNSKTIIDKIISDKLNVIYQVQLHKIVNIK